MNQLDTVRQMLQDSLSAANQGIGECNAQIEAARERAIGFQLQAVKVQAALDALEKTDMSRPSLAALPTLTTDFWRGLLSDKKLSLADLYALATDRLGLDPTSEQSKILRQRMSNSIMQMTKKGKVVSEGEAGARMYSLVVDAPLGDQ